MLVRNPLAGTIKPDKEHYPDHPDAVARNGSSAPLVTLDFGPTQLTKEPGIDWKGGEANIFGTPIAAKHYDHFHKAMDISTGGCGKDVLAAAKGTVTASFTNESKAKVIVIDHGLIAGHRYETRYVHLSQLLASVGDTVEPGDVIGKVGNTGTVSTGCHLHFAISKDGRPVDPWRRLAERVTVDPDLPIATPVTAEVPDVPIPASDAEYLAGSTAVVGNATLGAIVRVAPESDGELIRIIPGGTTESWNPTCWVKGDIAFGSDRWLTRWNAGRWEFTHFVNVASVTPL
jgi:murein DD-endopeptidase MepM/ murein hydrolase activator NlpD